MSASSTARSITLPQFPGELFSPSEVQELVRRGILPAASVPPVPRGRKRAPAPRHTPFTASEFTLRFTLLGLPPSANIYWRHTEEGTFRSEEARRYQSLVKRQLAEQGLIEPILAPGSTTPAWAARGPFPYSKLLRLEAVFYYGHGQRGDLDNLCKVLVDAISRAFGFSDAYIFSYKLIRRKDPARPRVHIKISLHNDDGEHDDLYPAPSATPVLDQPAALHSRPRRTKRARYPSTPPPRMEQG